MKQIDESKSQLKSLVKVTNVNSPYQIYTKQFNDINSKLSTYEKKNFVKEAVEIFGSSTISINLQIMRQKNHKYYCFFNIV